jgi:antitoxin ParD1/3/4
MTNLTISLPEALVAFIDEQVTTGGFDNSSQFVSQLVRMEQDRQKLRNMLLAGAGSPLTAPTVAAYFASLRYRVGLKSTVVE